LSVTKLTFGFWFNQPINGCIPYGVSKIIFGWTFNQPINDYIPSLVTEITFGSGFKQNMNCIPLSVRKITFIGEYSELQKLYIKENILRDNIETAFYDPFNHKKNDFLID